MAADASLTPQAGPGDSRRYMTLSDLLADVEAGLPEESAKAMAAIVKEYGASENCKFMLALVAAGTKRERRLARMLIRELELVGR